MKVELDVVAHSSCGITTRWRPGHVIEVTTGHDRTVHIRANREGLLTLAQHLVTLGLPDVSPGRHIHYDDDSGLEEGSADLVIELIGP